MIWAGLGIVALATLGWTLAELRGVVPRRGRDRRKPTALHHLGAACVLGLCNAELLGALALPRPILSGDLRSHAMVAREIASGHATGGWIDVYHAGFPLGPHYPSVAWLLSAGLMKLGLAPQWSIFVLAIAAVVTTNVLVYLLSLRAGAPFFAALLGAATISLVAPFSSFLGGPPAALVMGVISQVVVMPFALVCAHQVLVGRSRAALVIAASLTVATHPQVAASAMVLLGVVSIVRGRLRRWAVAGVSMAITGAAIFGPGLMSLGVPFGWPPIERWLIVGRPAGFFLSFLAEGEVLDFARPPVVTTFVACALLVLVIRARRADGAVSALVASAVTLALCLAGEPLSHLGRFGAALLGFFQPLRAYALLPVVGAVVVVIAATELGRAAEAIASRAPRLLGRGMTLLPLALVAGEVAPLAPLVLREANGRLHAFDAGPCGGGTPPGYDAASVEAALGRLGEGRFAYDPTKDLIACAAFTNLDFASADPIASPFVAGAHVGVIAAAFGALQPTKADSDRRAAVLGIRYFLQSSASPAPLGAGWAASEHLGPVTLYETPATWFGVGCRRELWRGDDRHVRDDLYAAFLAPDPSVWSPSDFVEIDARGSGPVARSAITTPCDATSARLLESRRVAPGNYRARVTSDADVDVVLRETAFEGWNVEVDGGRVATTLVAPGFMSVRLPPGDHVVTARYAVGWRYLLGLFVAACAIVALAVIRRAW